MKHRTKAIRDYCLDCCCGSAKEVTLCPAFDCQLWPFRGGRGAAELRQRMELARTNYAEELEDMARAGIEIARFFEVPSRKRARPAEDVEGARRAARG